MSRTLGLDLGTNSLGWAILDDITGDILDKGVVVFPEGIDAANDTLETPAAVRRAARMARRMKFRRKLRKWALLVVLIENGMCPMTEQELKEWKKSGVFPVNNKAFVNWLKSTDTSNPYADRAAAASGKVAPHVLGRALYHIAQRRGFKSSRKDAQSDGSEDKELGVVKGDIAALTKEIADAGCRTLGQYFAKHIESERNNSCKKRVRTRHTGRVEHYMTEFAVIMDAQGILHDNPLYKALYDAIFRQRPLRSQKHLVGPCPLEHGNPRAQIGHPAFEEFRMRAFVNNLSFRNTITGERIPLTAEDRELACSAFMTKESTIKFSAISKLFKKKFKSEPLDFNYYKNDDTISSCSTRFKIKNGFVAVPYDEQKVFDALTFFNNEELLKQWFRKHYPELPEDSVGKLANIHPKEGNAQYSLKAINKILPFLRKGHDLFTARLLAKMPDVIPHFAEHEDEIVLHIKEMAIKCRASREAMRSETIRQEEKPLRMMDLCRDYFLTEWNVDEKAWDKLYLHGDSPYEVDPKRPGRIPAVKLGMMRNPLVQRSMTTLRRLVNYLRDHGKIDGDTTIRIELARAVNNAAAQRGWQLWQAKRAKMRKDAEDEILSLKMDISEDAIDKCILWREQPSEKETAINRCLLWHEQRHQCLYTGRYISLREMLDGNSFNIEHTIPRSLSGDDSLANKTICEAHYNQTIKKGRTPRECPNFDEISVRLEPWRRELNRLEKSYKQKIFEARKAGNETDRTKIRGNALAIRFELDYWRDKLKRFEITSDKLIDPERGLSGFKRRQLVDTGIMSSHAVELLRSVYPRVYSVNGAATAFARKAWGIQGDETKDRSEHTHHAKDAMVIAALTPSRFNAICTALKDDGRSADLRPCDVCKPPYEGFAEAVRKAADEILVKHIQRRTTLRQSSKKVPIPQKKRVKDQQTGKWTKSYFAKGDTVRGHLHGDTYYGKILNPVSGALCTVERKAIEGEELKDVERIIPSIVDPAIREIVRKGVERLLADGATHVAPDSITMPSGVPIRKVRRIAPAKFNSPDAIKKHDYLSTKTHKHYLYAGSASDVNFRMAIYCIGGSYSYETESILNWAQGHKSASYIPLDTKPGFVGYAYPGTMVILCNGKQEEEKTLLKNQPKLLSRQLYYLRTLPTQKEKRCELQFHLEARDKKLIPSTDKGSKITCEAPQSILRLTANSEMLSRALFEGIHFKMMLDGTIVFLK